MNDRRLEKLLAQYEQFCAVLRSAIALVNNPPTARLPIAMANGNGNGRPGVGGDRKSTAYKLAARLDAERRAVVAKAAKPIPPSRVPKTGRKHTGAHADQIKRQRTLSARYLAQFHTDDPQRPKDVKIKIGHGVGALVRRGYLKKKAGGYIRTAKPYEINPSSPGAQADAQANAPTGR